MYQKSVDMYLGALKNYFDDLNNKDINGIKNDINSFINKHNKNFTSFI